MKISAFFVLCSRLNQAIAQHQQSITVPYSKLSLKFIFSLKKNRLIYGYRFSYDNIKYSTKLVIVVYLIYSNNLPIFSHIIIYKGKNQQTAYSHRDITTFQFRRQLFWPIYYFQTSQGFLTHYEVQNTTCGGNLVAKIN